MGIMDRYLREGSKWNSHLNNSKEYIINSLPNTKVNKVAILGSGWLLDVPVKDLCDHTNKLYLFDINHPKQILNKFKNHIKTEFVKIDLTNNLIQGAAESKCLNDFSVLLHRTKPIDSFYEYDFVVSLNLLNQLDILLCDFLLKKFKISNHQLIAIRKQIQTLHLKSLPKGKSCIITDFKEFNYMERSTIVKESNLVYVDLNIIRDKKDWLWEFDGTKSYRQKYNTFFKVIAGIL